MLIILSYDQGKDMKIFLDKEGKIAIPKAIRMTLGINPGDSLSIEATEGGILLIPLHEEKKIDIESVFVLSGKKEGNTKYFTLK